MPIKTAPTDTPIDATCAGCNHSPAYHDGETGRPCRAWNPDEPDNLCACKGWNPKPPPPPPTVLDFS